MRYDQPMQDFRNLRAWQSAREYCLALYDVTKAFPREERYGFTSQMRAAARSICANLAEGSAYRGFNDSARFYEMSLGSASESLSDMLLTKDLGMLTTESFDHLEAHLAPTRKQIVRLIQVTRRP